VKESITENGIRRADRSKELRSPIFATAQLA
jgi:hypothetical protein